VGTATKGVGVQHALFKGKYAVDISKMIPVASLAIDYQSTTADARDNAGVARVIDAAATHRWLAAGSVSRTMHIASPPAGFCPAGLHDGPDSVRI